MSQAEGQPFGKYSLLERIAVGGMAEIYRARYTAAAGVTKQIVIKKILPHYAGNMNFISMFVNEAKIAVGLSHGNIAQVFDFGAIDGEYFLAMEFVEGQPLSRVIRRARQLNMPVMPAPMAVLITTEICKGLHYAHTRVDDAGRPLSIIHRDVSPQNIIISFEGQVKLVDFGIAKARNATAPETQAGAVKGKYAYFAPEQARGKDLDARTDVFAAGTVLYEMLCGRLPFEGKMMDVLSRISRAEFPRPRALNLEISTELEDILLGAMTMDRKDRYATADAFYSALAGYLHSNAPNVSISTLSYFMQYLFEEDRVAEKRPVQLPPEFLEQLATWRKTSGTPTQSSSGLLFARPSRALERPFQRFSATAASLPRWVLWAAPLLATAVASLLVFAVGHFGTFSVRLTSTPSGATVIVDERAERVTTPVLIADLSARYAHRIEVTAPGMKRWIRLVSPVHGTTIPLHAELEPERPPAPRTAPTPTPAREPSPRRGADNPLGTFEFRVPQHALVVPASRAARVRLNPNRAYRMWTDGAISLSGQTDSLTEVFFFLEATDALSADKLSGRVGPRPLLVEHSTALYAFFFDSHPQDNEGTITVRIQPVDSGQTASLQVDARLHAVDPTAHSLVVRGLDPQSTYAIRIRPVSDAARMRTGPLLLVQERAPHARMPAQEMQRIVEPGRRYDVSSSNALMFTVLDDSREDNAGILKVDVSRP